MLDQIINFIKDEDQEASIRDIDLIVSISYGAQLGYLMNGTREALTLALDYKKKFPNATLAFMNCNHLGFQNCMEQEYRLKMRLLGDVSHVSATAGNNSILEAEAIRDSVAGLRTDRVLVVCGEMHSRSVRYIWEKVFPDAVIVVRCIPYYFEYQKDSPFWISKGFLRNLCMSIGREILLRTIGMNRMRGFHHNHSGWY